MENKEIKDEFKLDNDLKEERKVREGFSFELDASDGCLNFPPIPANFYSIDFQYPFNNRSVYDRR